MAEKDLPIKLENELERRIADDPAWREGIGWGRPRHGHPKAVALAAMSKRLEALQDTKPKSIPADTASGAGKRLSLAQLQAGFEPIPIYKLVERLGVLPWTDGHWLLPLRVGPSRLFDPQTGALSVFPFVGPDGKQNEFQQIVRTAKGTLLAMGPVLLHSGDEGRSWTSIDGFPAVPDTRDNAEGRYLATLSDGRVLVTWSVGHDNKGLHYNVSPDDDRTWNADRTVTLLPEMSIAARYYSARTVQLDDQHVGTVFMNGEGVHFLKVSLDRLAK